MSDKKLFLHKLSTFIADIICFFLAVVLNEVLLSTEDFSTLMGSSRMLAVLYPTMTALITLLFKCYSDRVQDYTLFNAIKIAGAIIFSNVFFAVTMIYLGYPVSFMLFLNLAVYSIALCSVYRFIAVSIYYVKENMFKTVKSSEMKRVIIFGAGAAGKYLANMLNQDR